MPRPTAIAIDGPVASGKTSVGRLLARRLGYRFLDTGVMYRAVAWEALRRGVPLTGEALSHLAGQLRIEVLPANGGERVLVDGEEVTGQLRRPEVERVVSLVARVPGVRRALVALQRDFARRGPVVMAGRDIGTDVLPHAPLKVFLEASPAERARRRREELRSQGQEVSLQEVMREIEERDRLDSQRACSPLRPAPDARLLSTDGLGVEEVVQRIMRWVEEG